MSLKIKMQSAKLWNRCAMEFNRPLGYFDFTPFDCAQGKQYKCARGDNEQ